MGLNPGPPISKPEYAETYFYYARAFFSYVLCHVFLALPVVQFTKVLTNQETVEGDKATLSCETSNPDTCVTWRKDKKIISEGEKYSFQKNGAIHTLVIHQLTVGDSGEYVCEVGDKQTKASLSVKGDQFLGFFSIKFPQASQL